jgi:hypothetical protein
MSDRDDDLDENECCEPEFTTLCDGNTTNNYWFEDGKCMLDDLYPFRRDQIIFAIERNPTARTDLPKITSCPDLLHLLEVVPLLPTAQEDDHLQSTLNKQDLLPFYTIFRGNCNNR